MNIYHLRLLSQNVWGKNVFNLLNLKMLSQKCHPYRPTVLLQIPSLFLCSNSTHCCGLALPPGIIVSTTLNLHSLRMILTCFGTSFGPKSFSDEDFQKCPFIYCYVKLQQTHCCPRPIPWIIILLNLKLYYLKRLTHNFYLFIRSSF